MTRPPAPVHAVVARMQHSIATWLGVDERKRGDTVLAMQTNNARRAPGYWIQLFLAMGIATLGLVLDSTAVVIGAMLVSPLMGPLLELGMGFAVGSSLLVIRAALRVVLSVLVVVAGAAVITLALPFHEITSEIAARTAPTALDLLVAVFCALTAAYTTVRPGADSTAAAAGTAIGIALVPPLCTIGFGLGTGSLDVAGGAALLFTANLSAILVFAVLSFLALGFNQVDAHAVEAGFVSDDDTRTDRLAARGHRLLRDLFGSRYGLAMRLMVPAIFLAGVYVPLRRALDEVTWEVRARDAIRRIVSDESPGAVQTSVDVERHTIALRLMVVGTSDRASALEASLTKKIADAAGVTPTVSIIPVADARTLAAVTAAETHTQPPPLAAPIGELTQRVTSALHDEWPAPAGRLAGWDIALSPHEQPTVVVRHLGAELGASGVALLEHAMASRLGTTIAIRDEPIPTQPIVSQPNRTAVWSDSAVALLATIARSDSVVACLRSPATDSAGRASDRALLEKLKTTDAARAGRLLVAGRGAWMIQAAMETCGTRAAIDSTRSAK